MGAWAGEDEDMDVLLLLCAIRTRILGRRRGRSGAEMAGVPHAIRERLHSCPLPRINEASPCHHLLINKAGRKVDSAGHRAMSKVPTKIASMAGSTERAT